MRLKFFIPVGVLLIGGLSACSGAAETSAVDSARAPAAAEQTQGGAGEAPAGDAGKDAKEEPLTGEIKDKAETAALAKFPGTVTKSEYDAEKPDHYAVEIQRDSGGTVEVYLDKSFKVVGTKDETGEKDQD